MPLRAPGVRAGVAIAYDSARGVTVLFGGDDDGTVVGDTWEIERDHLDPERRSPSPPRATRTRWCTDSARGVMVLFGGEGSRALDLNDGLGVEQDELDATHPGNDPAARDTFAMAYDSARGVTVVSVETFKRAEQPVAPGSGTGTNWTEGRPRRPSPPARYGQGIAYDSARGVTVMFGGTATAVSWRVPGSGMGRTRFRQNPQPARRPGRTLRWLMTRARA